MSAAGMGRWKNPRGTCKATLNDRLQGDFKMPVQPYLFFEGRCEEALDFYIKALGAKVESKMRYSENPEGRPPGLPSGSDNKIMHSAFQIGESTLMGSDGMCSGQQAFKGFSLSVYAKDEAEAKRLYAALSEGGQPQ